MDIAAGSRLGPYEITAPLGAGGMGEVWRGRDTRLDRSVAIKVLPAEFAQNAQLRLRFEREAKSISQLNHPNICTLYDVGSENGLDYLVMEMIEGQSLADRLTGGALPLDQVIRYGIEIAEALERAHKSGIVHRDLKPGNVMLTKSGAKLLDFGLAKPATRTVSGQSSVTPDDATAAAMAGRPLTEEGTIVGTFQYMAPEQIEGHEADARTDIFALGAVLYEMTTGRRAFHGKSKATLIASILATEPPPIASAQPASPATLDRLIRICLAKEPDERWQSAHDVAIELRNIRDAKPAASAPSSRRREVIAWLAAALAIAAAAVSWWIGAHRTPADQPVTIESGIPVPEGAIVRWPRISPDGTRLAFVGINTDGEASLFLHDMASGQTTKLPVSDPGGVPEWSPDSREILIRQANAVVRFSPASGALQTIATAAATSGSGTGYAWGSGGVVLIAPGDRIDRVPAGGGAAQTVIRPEAARGEQLVAWPSFLPDGNHFLYVAAKKAGADTTYTIWVSSLDGKVRKELVPTETDARFANGVLLFGRAGKLMGQPFDLRTLSVSGEAKVVADELVYAFAGATGGFSVSNNGLLIYRRAPSISASSRLVWYDATGRGGESGTLVPVGQFWDLSLSRDGRALAVQVTEPQKRPHIWSFDVARGIGTLVTPTSGSPNAGEVTPVWLPDGRSLLYASGGNSVFEIRRKALDGPPATILHNGLRNYVCDVDRDGRTAIIATAQTFNGKFALGALSLATGTVTPIGPPESSRLNAKLSPDEKWIAYVSNDTGRREVYVSPYPDARGMTRVSASGGQMPYWSADGRKLYFASGSMTQILQADVTAHGNEIEVGELHVLLNVHVKRSENTQFVVSPDGRRIFVNEVVTDPLQNPLTLVANWMTRVK